MANVWQEKPPIDEADSDDAMASVLEAMHGLYAAEVADFFSALHLQSGDQPRSTAWADVAARVRERQDDRLQS